ncbi:hypothetical protein CR513_16870, partial [Mucuna pruriens]
MPSSSFNMEDLSPKSRMTMEYMNKIEDKIQKLGGGLESVIICSNSVNAKIRTLSKMKEKEVMRSKESNSGDSHDESCASHNSDANDYYDWELKVEQNLDCIDCEDLIEVKLIALSFEGYTLILWNKIPLQIRASKVESQPRRHGKNPYPTISSNWMGKKRREDKLLKRDKSPKKGNASFKRPQRKGCLFSLDVEKSANTRREFNGSAFHNNRHGRAVMVHRQ